MTPARVLCAWNSKILESYSRHTVEALRKVLPLRLALPRLESFLAENVDKEQQKGEQIIAAVCTASAAGASLLAQDEALVGRLLAACRDVDSGFLKRVSDFPVGIVIRYSEIEPVRKRRIVLLATATERILAAWRREPRPRAALRLSHERAELERLVHELMRLYALETQLLSRSLKLPGLLVPLREKLAQSLYGVMNEVAQRSAREAAAIVYRAERS